MSVHDNLSEMERVREAYWRRYPGTSPVRLRWRALTVRHCFHMLPGESILEIGAGSGLWTEHLARVLRGENPITAAVFNEDLLEAASRRKLPNTRFVRISDLAAGPLAETFDYIVGTAILCHDLYAQNLRELLRLLKPGGQIFFFEANYWNPQVFLKSVIPAVGRWAGNAACQVGLRKYKLMRIASQQGFTGIEIVPYDILHPLTPRSWIPFVQSLAFVLEHAPLVRELCGTLYIMAAKPESGPPRRRPVGLATHRQLFSSTSVVIPCHNEEQTIPALVEALEQFYGDYLHEIILVNDNSTDRTPEVARECAQRWPRVRVVDRRPPNGVGLALRDGYAAARGKYILSMDCDFVQIVPELRDLFDVIAAGHDGAMGSRFSHASVLINYPFLKIVCNRAFHLLVKLFVLGRVRDVSNNLKLYRSEILKELNIRERHFAANVETGLTPILAGYDIREVPISWIDRTLDMGTSSFKILKVVPGYTLALLRTIRCGRRAARAPKRPSRKVAARSSSVEESAR